MTDWLLNNLASVGATVVVVGMIGVLVLALMLADRLMRRRRPMR